MYIGLYLYFLVKVFLLLYHTLDLTINQDISSIKSGMLPKWVFAIMYRHEVDSFIIGTSVLELQVEQVCRKVGAHLHGRFYKPVG